MRVKVNGKVYDVEVEIIEENETNTVSPVYEKFVHKTSDPNLEQRSVEPAPNMNSSSKTISSPLSGTVISVLKNVGDSVALNECVCILEAMKMETKINSTSAGIIKKVNITKGEMVQHNHTLFELE